MQEQNYSHKGWSSFLNQLSRNTGLSIFLLFLCINLSFGQHAISDTEKLASLAKLYGFLKYYHPEVAQGKFDWDQQVLDQIPKVLNASNKKDLSSIYLNWIEQLGLVEKCKKCKTKDSYFDKNFDLSWTQNPKLFTTELSSRLKYIENNRFQGEHFYASSDSFGRIIITNEPLYKDFEYPKEEYRLLGLFKYWNIIEYFYPYKYLTDQSWDSVLLEMLPKIRKAGSTEIYQAAIKELVAKLDDSHAWIMFSNQKYKYLPFKISHIENKAVVSGFYNDSLAKLTPLKLGDAILEIDHTSVQEELDKNFKYVAGSNKAAKTWRTYLDIFKTSEDQINLTVSTGGSIENYDLKTYNFDDFKISNNPSAIKSKSISKDIGYMDLAYVEGVDVTPIFKSFTSKKAIIIDLRNYPRMIFSRFWRFLNSEKRNWVKEYVLDMDYPSRFVYKDINKTFKGSRTFKGKIILLVNEKTLSRAEFTALALQTADNVITVGSQTAGADGDVAIFEYLGGYKTAITGVGVLYPNGSETQRVGIKIDIQVKPTIQGLREGRDEILDKAIEIANQ